MVDTRFEWSYSKKFEAGWDACFGSLVRACFPSWHPSETFAEKQRGGMPLTTLEVSILCMPLVAKSLVLLVSMCLELNRVDFAAVEITLQLVEAFGVFVNGDCFDAHGGFVY